MESKIIEITERSKQIVYYMHNDDAAALIGDTRIEITQQQFTKIYLKENITIVLNTDRPILLDTVIPIARGNAAVGLGMCKGKSEIVIHKKGTRYSIRVASDNMEVTKSMIVDENKLKSTSVVMQAVCLISIVALRYGRCVYAGFNYGKSVSKVWLICTGVKLKDDSEIKIVNVKDKERTLNKLNRWNEQLLNGNFMCKAITVRKQEAYYDIGEETVMRIMTEELGNWQAMLNCAKGE
jgi:hypothetical protein